MSEVEVIEKVVVAEARQFRRFVEWCQHFVPDVDEDDQPILRNELDQSHVHYDDDKFYVRIENIEREHGSMTLAAADLWERWSRHGY